MYWPYRRLPASRKAVWISAAVFGGIHIFGFVSFGAAAALSLLSLTLVGVILAILAESRQSIVMPIFTHMGFNLLALIVLLTAG